ncbi:MAG: hypothetical protein GXP62_04815 [Oligoflexia bacterium]|nr:hypothetical protein [Oligoflexia bacterium]
MPRPKQLVLLEKVASQAGFLALSLLVQGVELAAQGHALIVQAGLLLIQAQRQTSPSVPYRHVLVVQPLVALHQVEQLQLQPVDDLVVVGDLPLGPEVVGNGALI